MSTYAEAPLKSHTLAALDESAAQAAALLGVAPGHDPQSIVEAIDGFVFAWQTAPSTRPLKGALDPDDAPIVLGSLWGKQLIRRFGWEWRQITFHQHGDAEAAGVLAPDRSLAVYPFHFLMGCLQDANVDATILLSFNMLEAGNAGGMAPDTYFNLMEGVHRIVPRTAGDLGGVPTTPPPLKHSSWIRRFLGRH